MAFVGGCCNQRHVDRAQGLTYASKALSMTIIDLFKNPDLINDVKAEFLERKGDYVYEGMIPPGPPPLDFEQ